MKPAIAPIGLDYVADAAAAAGHDVRLCDLCFSEDVSAEVESACAAFQPEVIGVTVRNTDDCYFSGQAFFVPEIREMVDALRSVSDAPIVMGGVGFSIMPGAVMDFCRVDYGIAGEGERSFVRLLAALQGASGLEEVPGLLYRDAQGVLRRNPREFLDMDALPPCSRSLSDNRRYFAEGGQAGFETKRGCNMNCVYCADPVAKGTAVRVRSPELVVRELRVLLAQGIDHFHTCDCEFNIPSEHAREVCRAIIDAGLGEKVRWYAYCAVTPFDREMADLFKRAGCAGIDFGADSGSAEVLRALGRHFGPEDLYNTANLCREYGIPFMYDLLVGGPGETRDTVRETIDLVRRVDADCVGVAMGVRVYPGTRMADAVLARGEMASNHDLHGARHNNPHFLKPVFYISSDLGEGIVGYLHKLVGGDPRFFLPSNDEVQTNYNYNDNTVLVRAIRSGARGAYWDILRRMR